MGILRTEFLAADSGYYARRGDSLSGPSSGACLTKPQSLSLLLDDFSCYPSPTLSLARNLSLQLNHPYSVALLSPEVSPQESSLQNMVSLLLKVLLSWFFYYKKLGQVSRFIFGYEKSKICSKCLCNLLRTNKLQTIFGPFVTNWLSGDNNSPSSLNYIRPCLNYIRLCSAYKATCHHYIGTCMRQYSDFII